MQTITNLVDLGGKVTKIDIFDPQTLSSKFILLRAAWLHHMPSPFPRQLQRVHLKCFCVAVTCKNKL